MPSDPIGPQLLLLLFFFLLSALFVCIETAVITLSDAQLKQDAEKGDRKAVKLKKLADQGSRMLATTRFCADLFALLGAGCVATNFAPRLLSALPWLTTALGDGVAHALVLGVLLFVLGMLLLILSDIVPRSVGGRWPERVANAGSGLLIGLLWMLRPVIWLCTTVSNGILRLMHIDPNAVEEVVSEEEILYMVDMGEEKGSIERSEKEMIANIFEFSDLTVGDIMVHRIDVEFLSLSDEPDQIFNTIQETGYSRFPVYDKNADDIAGILMTRDYLLSCQSGQSKPLSELLTEPYFVPENARADKLFHHMQNSKLHMAIVVDEYGGTSGIVTLEDLLERIVGEIYDESDEQEAQDIQTLPDGRYRVAGRTPLRDLSEALDIELPEDDDLETLGGLILSVLSEFPKEGVRQLNVRAYDLLVQTAEVRDHRVEWAVVQVMPAKQTEDAEPDADID